MSGWINIIIGLAIVAAVATAFHMGDNALRDHYVAPVQALREQEAAAAKVQIDACTANVATVTAANTSLQDSLGTLQEQVTAQNALIDRLQAAGGRAKAERERILADASERLRAYTATSFDLLYVLSAADKGGTCDEKLRRIDDQLRSLGVQRLRDHPPASPGPAGSDKGGAGGNQGSGDRPVRISP